MNLPKLNSRILQVIDYKTNGNISAFAKIIDVSQQKLDRLFKIDNRTQKVPSVPSEILVNITEKFNEIDSDWLLMGNGEMLKIKNTKSTENVTLLNEENKTKSTENVTLLNCDKNCDILEKYEKYRKSHSFVSKSDMEECLSCYEKDRIIEALKIALEANKGEIQTLYESLNDKRQTIAELREHLRELAEKQGGKNKQTA